MLRGSLTTERDAIAFTVGYWHVAVVSGRNLILRGKKLD